MCKYKVGHLPSWTIISLFGGRPAIVRNDLSKNKRKSVIQFADKTASMINKTEPVEVVSFASDLVFQKVSELELAYFGQAQANQQMQATGQMTPNA